jgi:hypothetical protein
VDAKRYVYLLTMPNGKRRERACNHANVLKDSLARVVRIAGAFVTGDGRGPDHANRRQYTVSRASKVTILGGPTHESSSVINDYRAIADKANDEIPFT